jgi:hypothetical protein
MGSVHQVLRWPGGSLIPWTHLALFILTALGYGGWDPDVSELPFTSPPDSQQLADDKKDVGFL